MACTEDTEVDPLALELTYYQGKLWALRVKVRDENGRAFDLSNYTAAGQVRLSASDAFVYATWAGAAEGAPTRGVLLATIGALSTATVPPGRYVFDLEIRHTSDLNDVRIIAAGTITVLAEVTR